MFYENFSKKLIKVLIVQLKNNQINLYKFNHSSSNKSDSTPIKRFNGLKHRLIQLVKLLLTSSSLLSNLIISITIQSSSIEKISLTV